MTIRSKSAVLLAIILLAAAAWKAIFVFWDVTPFNADEAVVALMARHILKGDTPVFFYGQAYMGSLDAYLVAAGFALFGQQVWVIRLVQGLLYLGTVLTTFFIGRVAFDSDQLGLLAAGLLVVPAVNVTLYTTASLGGYGEALLLGNLLLLLSFFIVRRLQPRESKAMLAALLGWGVLAGGGLWANGLTLVFSVPSGLYIIWATLKRGEWWRLPGYLGMMLLGILLGALPLGLYAFTHGAAQMATELLGTAVAVEQGSWLVRTGSHLINFILLGLTALFGFRPPWSVTWLALPLLPFVMLFWMGAAIYCYRRMHTGSAGRAEAAVLTGVIAVTTAGFLFTPFGIDPSGRYFLPMVVPLALGAAAMILNVSKKHWQAAAMTGLLLAFHGWGTLQCALAFPPGLTTQFYEPSIIDHRADAQLIAFLKEKGETRGYSNYWVAYPLAFLSGEDLVFTPRLPYHLDGRYTPRDDRYAHYSEMVAASERVAYITTRNPLLDEHLRAQFKAQGITWEEQQINDYRVYYALSQPLRPEQIGLGSMTAVSLWQEGQE